MTTDALATKSAVSSASHQSIRHYADRLAIMQGGREISYDELAVLIDQAAKGLLSLGVRLQDRVGLWSSSVWETIVLQCAIWRIGAVAVHLPPEWNEDDACGTLDELRAVCVFARAFNNGRQYPAMLKSVRARLPHLRSVIVHGRQARFEKLLPSGWTSFLEAGETVSEAELLSCEARAGKSSDAEARIVLFDSAGNRINLSERIIARAARHVSRAQGPCFVATPLHEPLGIILGCFVAPQAGMTVVLPSPEGGPSDISGLHPRISSTLVMAEQDAAYPVYKNPDMAQAISDALRASVNANEKDWPSITPAEAANSRLPGSIATTEKERGA